MSDFTISRIDEDSWQIALEGDWDIRHVQKLYDALAEGVALSGAIQLDLGGLLGADAETFQLLLAVRALCEQRGQTFRCVGLAEPLAQLIAHMGLSADLQAQSAVCSCA